MSSQDCQWVAKLTEDGYYWCLRPNKPPHIWRIITTSPNTRHAYSTHSSGLLYPDDFVGCLWSGPLEAPKIEDGEGGARAVCWSGSGSSVGKLRAEGLEEVLSLLLLNDIDFVIAGVTADTTGLEDGFYLQLGRLRQGFKARNVVRTATDIAPWLLKVVEATYGSLEAEHEG